MDRARASLYTPDNWVVIKISEPDPHYRVLAGWSGGYTTSDSWRLNSGIVRVTEMDNHLNFYGSTNSCYRVHKESYGLRMNNGHIWNKLKEMHGDAVEMMPEDTDWLNVDWIIK